MTGMEQSELRGVNPRRTPSQAPVSTLINWGCLAVRVIGRGLTCFWLASVFRGRGVWRAGEGGRRRDSNNRNNYEDCLQRH